MRLTTISIKEGTKKELIKLQEIYKTKSMDELLKILILKEQKGRMDDFSDDFRRRLKEKNLTIEDMIKSSEEIRKEILRESGIFY